MSWWLGYLLAGAFIALATVVRLALPDTLGPTPYLTFYPAVVAAAGFCGRGPGLLATFSSLLIVDLCFDETPTYIDIHDPGVFGRAAIFLAGGVAISVFAGMQRTLRDRERKQSQELRESEELRRVALQAARMGTWDYDTATGQIDYDLRTQSIFGVDSPPDTYRKFIEVAVHRDDAARVDAAVRRALDPQSDGAYSAEYRVLWPDGSLHWIQAHGQTVFDGSGWNRRAERMVGTAQDITDRKEAEAFLKAARQSAEQARADAERANRAKGHFLAVLSHELRTPLTPVVMGVSLLQDRNDLDADLRVMLEMVRRNVEMEARLIDDLLDVTRIERGKIELSRTPVELCTVVQRAFEVCQPDIEARQLHFGVDIGADGPYWIEADVPRLQQVFWNLLKNAIKFTPRGGCIGIRCRRDEHCVAVEVNDSGIGIEPDALPRIFNAFEQADNSITRQFGGLGLGLAISKALVEMHGAKISVHSKGRNHGATFCVRLPLSEPASGAVQPRRLTPASRARRPLHILLVEDHGVTADILQKALAADGHTVDRAGDVTTALRLADCGGIDLLLSDLGLPDGSGHDLMKQLHRRGHRFPGIALSGYGQDEDIRRSRQAGFSAHLTKPASRELVMETIAAVLRGEMWAMIDNTPTDFTHNALVFDAQAAIKKCWGDHELFAQMIQCFIDDCQSFLPQIIAAAHRADFPALGKLANRFKGTIVHLGAELAGEAIANVERMGLYGSDPAEAVEAVKWLERECEILKQALSEFQAPPPSDPQEISHTDRGV